MKKYRFKRFGIELTRRCNYNCAHCLQGAAENVTITPKIIDTMFSQIEQADQITLFGGECLLELNMIKYLIEAIDRYNLKTKEFDFVTNGSILDARLIDMLSSFTSKLPDRKVFMHISNDEFHDEAQSNKCLEFYNSQNTNGDQIEIALHGKFKVSPDGKRYNMLYSGRAISFRKGESTLNGLPISVSMGESSFRTHQIKITNHNTIECLLILGANGNLFFYSEVDYVTFDKLAFGDILTASLHDIITANNETSPFLCDECENERICYNVANLVPDDPEDAVYLERIRLKTKIKKRTLELTWALRERLKQQHSGVHMHNIILETIFDDEQWAKIFLVSMGKKLQRDIDKYWAYPNIRRKIKTIPEYVAAEKARTEYVSYFKRKFPDISEQDAEMLSLNHATYKHLMTMTVDDLSDAIYGSHAFADLFGRILEQTYLQDKESAELNVCALIPDTFTPRDDEEEAQNNESDTQE